jgi:PGF-pre-PGF domain-containing protein
VESKRHGITLFVIIVLFSTVIAGNGAAATEIIVHKGESIQAAIDSSGSGETIILEPGTYEEQLSISSSDLTIISQSENPDDTVINGSGITIWASNITIKGFTIKGNNESSGITVINRIGKCLIENNKLLNCISGIEIPAGSKLNVVKNNEISNCQNGITFFEGINNDVSNNEISDCQAGITFRDGSGNIISGNEVSNCQDGITYLEGFENIINENEISNCRNGISAGNGDATLIENRAQIKGNTVTKNDVGVGVSGGGGYTIKDNTITLNKKTGYEDYSTDTNLIYNNLFNNNINVKFGGSSRYGASGFWNTSRTAGTNIIGGSYIGGNYWATPAGNGFSQTHPDSSGDGIAEVRYSLNGVNIDYLPLAFPQTLEPLLPIADFITDINSGQIPLSVQFTDSSLYATGRTWDFGDGNTSTNQNPTHTYYAAGNYIVNLTAANQNGTDSKLAIITVLEQNEPQIPAVNFTTNITQGSVPLSVQFMDLSQNETSRIWDFNNDGTTDSFEETAVYVYIVPGNYVVNLTAINENGMASKLGIISATEKNGNNSDENGSKGNEIDEKSHSSSSGSLGITREPAENIEAKELAQAFVRDGEIIRFDFEKNNTCVLYVSFDAKTTAGETTAIAEMLKGKSFLVSDLPSDKVYRFFNIWIGDGKLATPKNIENATVCFRVEKSWLQNNSVNQSSITLNRYSDKKWTQLQSNLLREDSKYLYFTAKTSGFPSFVITGKENSFLGENKTEINSESDITDKQYNTETTGLDSEQKQKKTSIPDFRMGTGILCLFLILMYKKGKSFR